MIRKEFDMVEKPKVFCKDCMYCADTFDVESECRNQLSLDRVNFVTGHIFYLTCDAARSDSERCGITAKYFVSRESARCEQCGRSTILEGERICVFCRDNQGEPMRVVSARKTVCVDAAYFWFNPQD